MAILLDCTSPGKHGYTKKKQKEKKPFLWCQIYRGCVLCAPKANKRKKKKAKLNWKHTNRRTGRSNSRQLLLAANWTRTNGGDVNDPRLHKATGMSNSAERVILDKTSLELSKFFCLKTGKTLTKIASIWILVLWILVGIYKWNRYLMDCVDCWVCWQCCKANQFWWAGKKQLFYTKGRSWTNDSNLPKKSRWTSLKDAPPGYWCFLGDLQVSSNSVGR